MPEVNGLQEHRSPSPVMSLLQEHDKEGWHIDTWILIDQPTTQLTPPADGSQPVSVMAQPASFTQAVSATAKPTALIKQQEPIQTESLEGDAQTPNADTSANLSEQPSTEGAVVAPLFIPQSASKSASLTLQARLEQAEAALTPANAATAFSLSKPTSETENTSAEVPAPKQNDSTNSNSISIRKRLTPQVGLGTFVGTAAGLYLGGPGYFLWAATAAFVSSVFLQEVVPKRIEECRRRSKRD